MAKGEVIERDLKNGRSFALRVSAYGERPYLTLGFDFEGWTREKAREELENILADVRRGIWVPPQMGAKKRAAAGVEDRRGREAPEAPPLFGPFASGIVASRKGQVGENTTRQEEWALTHLLPFFADWHLHEIDIEAVDEYRAFKVRESEARERAIARRKPQRNERGQVRKPLAPTTVNTTIDVLQFLLGVALERKLIAENPAAGSKRRLKVPPRRPVHLDTAGQIEALLLAGAELDREPARRCREREAILATLVFAGPRAHELCLMRWRDLDLANGRLLVGRSKTQAGLREIELLPILRDVLAAYKAAGYRGRPDDLLFPNIDGGPRNKDTLRRGVLEAAFKRADRVLEARGQIPLPKGLTAHKLRHTFASILIACGEDPTSVMRQLGHTDPSFTLRVYTHMMSREAGERRRLKALVRGERVIAVAPPPPERLDSRDYELPILRALIERGGSATRAEVIAAVGEAMGARHGGLDLEPLPSGPPRWQARVSKARSQMLKRGWIETGSQRGLWEVSKLGRAKARREERKANRDRLAGTGLYPAREPVAA
jgi:integrase